VAHGTIGVRVPAHPVALELLARTGPLAASSANRSGEPTPATAEGIRALFGSHVDAYLDGGTIGLSGSGSGSTVVDVTGSTLRILRSGGVPPGEVERVVRGPI
jgi:tRNA A37 threonylcarbamoyladenosine synthetase subunit TsaC/SUA5/YrdC